MKAKQIVGKTKEESFDCPAVVKDSQQCRLQSVNASLYSALFTSHGGKSLVLQ